MDQISIQKGRIVTLEEGNGLEKIIDKVQAPVAAVVVMACNRANYLERILQTSKFCSFKVSPFCIPEDPDVKSKALSYNQLTYMQHLDHEPVHTERPEEMIVYYKIARHYKWALDQLFYKHNFSRVIILEDDMEISPDFFDYFEAAVALLESPLWLFLHGMTMDKNSLCRILVSSFGAWIDMLYRSDFFPGLGWMLAKSTWDELSPNGSSLGQYFKQYLEPIKLNGVQVDWKSMELNYLMEDKYVKHFADMVKNARPVCGTDDVLKECNIDCDVRIQYKDETDFEHIARQFGIFEEWEDGVPRTAYKGVVVFRYQSPKRVFLVGPESLQHLGI
ncbi:unnamed protein product [Camellia sinensis]